MKRWWTKWTYDIPLFIGDALRDVLVVQFAAFLDRLTIRKVIEFVAIAVLVMAFVQTLPVDLAILFAGDTLMYLEILVAIRLAAGKELLTAALRMSMRLARVAISGITDAIIYATARATRTRERRTPSCAERARRIATRSDDEPYAGVTWGALAMA
jgi:hypothetical protein